MPYRTQHIDYEAAVKARGGFAEAVNALRKEGLSSGSGQAVSYGIAAEACAAAEEAIFHAFNVLHAHIDDQEAKRVVHMREWEEPEQTYAGMAVKADDRMPSGVAVVTGLATDDEPPAFVTERVDTCLWEIEAAVAKVPVLANAKVGTVHGTSDGGWRVEVRINDQVFAPRFDTLDKATEYRREAAEIVERAA